jgi:N-acetylmuramoyl-L-alanine amidase
VARRSQGEQPTAIGLFVVAVLLGVAYVGWLTADSANRIPTAPAATSAQPVVAGPTRTLRPTRTPRPTEIEVPPSRTAELHSFKVGVVAGHWQNDSGAVCPDGLQEVDINLDVASRAVALLQERGYIAELLPEFSDSLNGYRADAFVSIHSDSCAVSGLSGFKVARVAASAIPTVEDRLVECLRQEYEKGTGLGFHKNTITFDMMDYHAFREIDPNTPGAIVELGFMDKDRKLLTRRSSVVAQSVVQGIVCFLESN